MNWLIDFRGSISEESELNMDGSCAMRAVCVVTGDGISEAFTNILTYTRERGIIPFSILRFENLSGFIPTSEPGYTSSDIESALSELSQERLVVFSYAISSEAEGDIK